MASSALLALSLGLSCFLPNSIIKFRHLSPVVAAADPFSVHLKEDLQAMAELLTKKRWFETVHETERGALVPHVVGPAVADSAAHERRLPNPAHGRDRPAVPLRSRLGVMKHVLLSRKVCAF